MVSQKSVVRSKPSLGSGSLVAMWVSVAALLLLIVQGSENAAVTSTIARRVVNLPPMECETLLERDALWGPSWMILAHINRISSLYPSCEHSFLHRSFFIYHFHITATCFVVVSVCCGHHISHHRKTELCAFFDLFVHHCPWFCRRPCRWSCFGPSASAGRMLVPRRWRCIGAC